MHKIDHTELDTSTHSPEKSLLVAVLARAVLDARRPPPTDRYGHERLSYDQWEAAVEFFSSPSRAPMSLSWICDHLDLDPEILRQWAQSKDVSLDRRVPYGPPPRVRHVPPPPL